MGSGQGKLFIGTSNIVLPGAKKTFPKKFQSRSRLYYYSTQFNSVELNSTFYKVPRQTTFSKWADDVAGKFAFTAKLWKEITHRKNLTYSAEDIVSFMEASQGIGRRKGCLLIQFPASITAAFQDHVEKLLDDIEACNEELAWQLCVEFRHASWYHDGVYEMLHHRKACPVFHDIHSSRTPLKIASAWPVIYLRFHGPKGDYRGDYSDETLRLYASEVRGWLSEGKAVYAYFNNTMGNAFENAQTLKKLIN